MSSSIVDTKALSLPEPVTKRGISEAQWRTLVQNLYPGAHLNSVLMVWDYCKARKLDPLKKPCHIVPMEVKVAATGKYEWRDVVMPGIYEYRTTAQRTGKYLGHSVPEYGPAIDVKGVEAPEWCAMTMYRWNSEAGQKVEYPVRTYFREVVGVSRDGKVNARWTKAPIQMLTKCTEAAGLRETFPDEFGGEPTAEEMDGQRAVDLIVTTEEKTTIPKPDGFDEWVVDLQSAADEGEGKLGEAWAKSLPALREYLAATDAGYWESLKERAASIAAEAGA